MILPQIMVPKCEEKRSEFILFRRKVYHQATAILLDSIQVPSHFGFAHRCADGVIRNLYPFIYIIASDFLEQ